MTHANEKEFTASLVYNEKTKKITMEFSGFDTDMEAKGLCYILMEQFGNEQKQAHLEISSTVH